MIRKTAHAGTFYPRFGNQISALIDKWIEEAPAPIATERNLCLLVPHAGYIYSGKCASLGLASISNEHYESIIILHPSHQGNHFDFSVSPYTEYETPLGNLELDQDIYAILSRQAFQNLPLDYHALEHSMEIQLPLLRFFFPQARICPVMIGNQVPQVAEQLATLLYDLIYKSGKRILILVSSDLSHYHKASVAEKMDALVAKHIQNLDAEALWKDSIHGNLEACGIGGIMSMLQFSKKFTAPNARVIQHTHSGKTSGNDLQVVGYLAAKTYI